MSVTTRVVNRRTYRGPGIYIGRGSPFGNPYRIGPDGDRAEVIRKYQIWFVDRINKKPGFYQQVLALEGQTLTCWCKPKPCHGDVILWFLETCRDIHWYVENGKLAGHEQCKCWDQELCPCQMPF